jgi:hypothetical protein
MEETGLVSCSSLSGYALGLLISVTGSHLMTRISSYYSALATTYSVIVIDNLPFLFVARLDS